MLVAERWDTVDPTEQEMSLNDFVRKYMKDDIASESLLRLVSYCSRIITVVFNAKSKTETYLRIDVDEQMNVLKIQCVANTIKSVRNLLFELSQKGLNTDTVVNKELTRIFNSYVTIYTYGNNRSKKAPSPLKLYTVGEMTGVLQLTERDEFGIKRNVLIVNYTRPARQDRIDIGYAVRTAIWEIN